MKKGIVLFLVWTVLFCFCGCREKVSQKWAPGYIAYTNESIGIQFEKRFGWVFEEAQLYSISNMPRYDMIAHNSAGACVEVTYAKMSDPQEDNTRYYLENTVKLMSKEFGDISEKCFCGQTYFCVDGAYGDREYRCYARDVGDYIVLIYLYPSEKEIQEIEDMFSEING